MKCSAALAVAATSWDGAPWLGIGLNPEMVDAPEGKTVAAVVVEALRQEGLLSVPAGPETVRLLPPLNVSEEEVQQALAIIRRVLKTYVK